MMVEAGLITLTGCGAEVTHPSVVQHIGDYAVNLRVITRHIVMTTAIRFDHLINRHSGALFERHSVSVCCGQNQ